MPDYIKKSSTLKAVKMPKPKMKDTVKGAPVKSPTLKLKSTAKGKPVSMPKPKFKN